MTKKKQAGKRLRDAREAAGLTQKQLAQAAGLARMTVVRIENGMQEGANLVTLQRLAKALGVRLLDLADVEESPIEEVLVDYLQSPYSQIDDPTQAEIDWLRTIPAVFWGEIKPSPAALHELIQLQRKFPA